MRVLLATLCAAILSLGSPCAHAAATGPAATGESPEELYEEGRKDYRLGRFKEAIDKWEEAYAIAELPLLLYNIALAYRQLYDVSADVEDLRKGKVVLKNFLVVAERDPDVDPADAKLLMEEIDKLLENAESESPEDPAPIDDVPERPEPVSPTGEDPGKKLRLAGAVTMGVGGAFVVTGVVVGVVYALKGGNFRDDLRNYQVAEMNGEPCIWSDGRTVACADAISNAREYGRRSNLYSGLGFGLGGALGLAAIATGAVLFVQGNRKSAAWSGKAARLQIGPQIGRQRLGMAISGRF